MKRRQWIQHFSLPALLMTVPGLAKTAAGTSPRRIVVLGDSLSAEYGIARGSGWVALLEQKLKDERLAAQVINASISGDTSSGGRSRLPALLSQHKPTHLIIELGGNDALRGLPLAMTRENLQAMVRAGKAAGAKVLLVGMQVPPNYGASYGRDFAALFEAVARAEKTALTPFLLAGVADRPDAESWFQGDRIHPLAKAHPLMLSQVWRALRPLL
ncbi:arylesterase [Paucibacter sp. PLA-PC-4]|uniref:arylesterase n=1 Tax=Paucibacter sp. PLA-PC-4 TaxID=2993655 RepID=UPI003A4C6F0E